MKRTDLTAIAAGTGLSPIQMAIGDAIYFYQQKRFFFQETTDSSTTTVAGTNVYTPPQDLLTIDDLLVIDNSAELSLPLNEREISWILERDTNIPPYQGTPTDYAWYGNQVRLWPTPDAGISGLNYVLKYYYRGMIPPPVNPTDQGYWMTTGELMIRSMAKSILYDQWLKNPVQADRELKISDAQFMELQGQNYADQFTGSTKPHRF